MSNQKIVYLCAPHRGDVDRNIRNIKIAARHAAVVEGVAPIVPHLLYPAFLDDNNEDERSLGIELDLRLIDRCDELWFYGSVFSSGMKAEITHAREMGVVVKGRMWPQEVREDIRRCSRLGFIPSYYRGRHEA